MYRVLVVDDEGIMRQALTNIILNNLSDIGEFEVETAKSGRAAIEQAEALHPDIIFMDIQMPGLNGIQAIREIRRFNQSVLCYVLSAYDKFDYAKEAIALGVEKYLMKPISKNTVISVMKEAVEKVEKNRRQRSDRIRIQEKLEIVIPVIENGFVGNILTQTEWQDAEYYLQLLDIQEEYGYVLVIQFGSDYENGKLVSSVGLGVKAQKIYPELCAIVHSFRRCIIGGIMSNRISVVVPHVTERIAYEERIRIIEETRQLVTRLEERLDMKFRIGIGRNRTMNNLRYSYQEAFGALSDSNSRVVHTDDVSSHGNYEGEFPAEVEENMYRMAMQGDAEAMRHSANEFFDWMVTHHPENRDTIRLKVLEFVMITEKEAFRAGAVNYGFMYRKDYLSQVLSMEHYEDLRNWFLDKMTAACLSVRNKKDEQAETVVSKAKTYIGENFNKDISLDDVSKEVNISPYYFSKLFKEEEGENFIEYLTRLRLDQAKEMLKDPTLSVKEISIFSGYGDPNYFSRIFKKQTDMTPREWREKYC